MISDLFKRFFMVKFCKSEKKSHLRDVQENQETEIGRLGIPRRIFFTLSETNYKRCVPPFRQLNGVEKSLEILEQRDRHAAFLLPTNVQISSYAKH